MSVKRGPIGTSLGGRVVETKNLAQIRREQEARWARKSGRARTKRLSPEELEKYLEEKFY